MSTAIAPTAHNPDVAGQITYAMRSMGIAPIPRNYELFYEAYIGSNPALTRALAALGSSATQEELDAIGAKYFPHHASRVFDDAHARLTIGLDTVLRALRQEQATLQSYNRLLGETYDNISSRSHNSAELLRGAIDMLTAATGDTMAQGEKTVENVVQRSQEMDQVRKELDEYKRIANTDALTRLANRRAFEDRLASIFDNRLTRPTTALVLADIDHFKRINDTFGHPVGDKILATVASVIRARARRDIFVARVGGEEFALILEATTIEEVATVCERIRHTLETTPFKNSRTRVDYGPITLSLGACMASEAVDSGELYNKADLALYCAKNGGRNCCSIYQEGMQKDFTKSWLIYKN
ncbi:GGDEF domain-containing protein [Rhizobium tropici]|uniref:diguanylate cyclase n=1 Tax=Rhizobium tropici TaxID=398 RepID=A0A329YFU5_RHITR|nr:GGDEF domain-containing protein [Rhizobium tropici]RAX39350.1 GGDEF domain-containing protein [Rhizobium tropici]